MKKFYTILLLLTLGLSNCSPSIPYHQRHLLKDPDMKMGKSAGKSFGAYVHSIREGSNPISNPKASGGCGCN